MDSVDVPPNETVALSAAAPGVHGLRTLIVNVVAIVGDKGWVLVDAGLGGYAESIRQWARKQVGPDPPQAIVLTHGHFDHVGSLKELLEQWDVPVWAHRDEMPFLTGRSRYPPPDPSVGGGLMARMSSLFPNEPVDLSGRIYALPMNCTCPGLSDWRWIPTPGHTPGHVSLFRASDRTLVVGDAFCTTKQESLLAVATQRPELHGPPAYFTTNWEAARQSVQALAMLEPVAVIAGHGPSMSGPGTMAALYELAARFDEVARPEQGRYVSNPDSGAAPVAPATPVTINKQRGPG